MAARGVRPKPSHLRLVDGTHRTTRHGDAAKARAAVEKGRARFGALEMPKGMPKDAVNAWRKWILPAYWLDASREAAAIAFCQLWNEFSEAPRVFPAAKHQQLRAYMSELGLTDERNRSDDPDEKKDEFFAD